MIAHWHRVRLALVTAVLLGTVWLGIREGFDGYRYADSALERIAGSIQILYGFAAVACLVGLWARRVWLPVALIAWGTTMTATASLGPVAYSGAGWGAAVLAGASAASVSALVAWGAMAHSRAVRPPSPPAHSAPKA